MQHSQKRIAPLKLDVERVQLPNGIVLLLSESHSIPSVSVNTVLRVGSRFELDAKAGLASLTGELLDSGTSTRTSKEIAESIEAAGGHLGTFGDYQLSGVAVTLLSKDLGLGLDVSSDLLLNATFPEDKTRQEVERRVAQIRSRLDEPRIQASDAFNEIVFEGTPQHRPPIGYEDTVKALTRSDVVEFYRRHYVPHNTLLAIVGDLDKSEVKGLVEATYGKWEGTSVLEPPRVPRPRRRISPLAKFVYAPKEQVNILIGHVGVERKNPDYYALLVMDTILGSSPGFTSRIPRVLRDEQGLAYSTFSNITSSASLDPGRFVAYIGTAPENLDRAIAGLRDEIQRIVDEPVTADELEVAKLYLTGSFVFRFQRNAQIADFLIEAELYGLGFDYLEHYPELIRSVTVEDVSRVARAYIDPAALTTVVVGPVDEYGKVIVKEGA
ncbi:MAG TPA: pitrilysin family protein [Blastocatellia bacterium]|nr:pitrilysin family protein [Blastocatellia bacterium]